MPELSNRRQKKFPEKMSWVVAENNLGRKKTWVGAAEKNLGGCRAVNEDRGILLSSLSTWRI
jgi:hypothetical protein